MKISIQHIGCVLLFILILGGAFFVPPYEGMNEVGLYLLRESASFSYEWRENRELAAHLLGDATYFTQPENVVNYREILALGENEESWQADDVETQEHPSVQAVATSPPQKVTKTGVSLVDELKKTKSTDFLLKNFYIVDSTTSVTAKDFNVKKMLSQNFTLKKEKGKKQILIYHTHGASEAFVDSSHLDRDSVVGVGDALTEALEKKGYGVIHDRTKYDLVNGNMDRSLAYNEALKSLTKTLKENPSIEVVIDLHRDSVGKGKHTYTSIDGKKCAIVMFFNGMSRTRKGAISYLYNPNLSDNLAFSLQLKCKAMQCYEGFTKPIYLKGYRYNLHMKKRSLLIELGNENNTVEEAKNATTPLADVISRVLSGS